MNVKGKIEQVLKLEKGTTQGGKQWMKQSIVVNNGDKFNPNVCITFFGDKIDLLNGIKKGDNVDVAINISSRDFNGKWYHNIDGWKITKEGGNNQQSMPDPSNNDDDSDGLPF